MMKAKILIDDASGRFKAGEIGELVEHNFNKYDYCVNFGIVKDVEVLGEKIDSLRQYYFYKDEVEIIDD